MSKFTKNDLITGDMVLFRDGDLGVLINSYFVCRGGQTVYLDDYDDDMRLEGSPHCDIMKVSRGAHSFSGFYGLCSHIVYDRDSETAIEMTMEEVCKALGKNIKIVKEK